ncbi:DUF4214 domain-containing protein [Mesorhizobium sp. CAU 1741]|uniref:DUF4214 domain-containing protein n=1 Tax=Mesorhizobium sp. CAU 1741 TaxID=3140366 RepID=UPI00325AD9C5
MSYYANEDQFPFTTVAFIEARFGSEWSVGSGVLVGRNDVLTASHVIYDPLYGLADEVHVYLAYNPAFPGTSYAVEYFEYFTEFDPDGDGLLYAGDGYSGTSLGGAELDIALLSLGEAVGDTHGYMGLSYSFTSGYANVTGHPGYYDNYMTNDDGYVSLDYTDHFIDISGLEINPGNSGGPIWFDNGSGPYVVGVVSTSGAAASITGHSDWLATSIAENDYLIGGTGGGSGGTQGTAGDDFILQSDGPGSYDGLGGTDTIILSGNRSSYTVTLYSSEDVSIGTGAGSAFDLVDFERAEFIDGTLVFDITSGNAPAAYRLYGGAFDRVPDEGGLQFWIDYLDQGGTLRNAASQFIGSAEFVDLFGAALSNGEFVEQLYVNVLGRPGEDAGVAYWTGYLGSGGDRADALVNFTQLPEYVGLSQQNIDNGYWVT